jgi:hypothetical protein
MGIQATAAMILAISASGWGGEKIQVYVNGGNIATAVLVKAEDTASRMLATAGVQIAWRFGAPRSGEAIVVDFSEHTTPNDHPGAMAYARPYEGVHIVVLYDRMQKVPGRLLPVLLAHVLVHELTHLLEAVEHHSATGIMKAHWDENDYNQMLRAPLKFALEDIEMIQRGIAARRVLDVPGSPCASSRRSTRMAVML